MGLKVATMLFMSFVQIYVPEVKTVELKNMCQSKKTVIVSYGPYTFELKHRESRPLDSFYLVPPEDPDDEKQIEKNLLCVKWGKYVYAFTQVNLPWMEENDNTVPLEIQDGRVPDCDTEHEHPFLVWGSTAEEPESLCPDTSRYRKCFEKYPKLKQMHKKIITWNRM